VSIGIVFECLLRVNGVGLVFVVVWVRWWVGVMGCGLVVWVLVVVVRVVVYIIVLVRVVLVRVESIGIF